MIIVLFAFSGAIQASVQKDSIFTTTVDDSVWVYLNDSAQTYISDTSVTISEFLKGYAEFETDKKNGYQKAQWRVIHFTNNKPKSSTLYLA